jgi:hypothetical protein
MSSIVENFHCIFVLTLPHHPVKSGDHNMGLGIPKIKHAYKSVLQYRGKRH